MAVGALIHELSVYSIASSVSQITQARRNVENSVFFFFFFLIMSKYTLPIYRFTSWVSHQ